jgi:hypothetical protein
MDAILQLIMELGAGQDEQRTRRATRTKKLHKCLCSELKSSISAVNSELKSKISFVSSHQVELGHETSAVQEQLNNDLRDEISATETKINAGQAEMEETTTDALDRQLKGVTSVVDQTRNLRQDFGRTSNPLDVTWRLRGATSKLSWRQ